MSQLRGIRRERRRLGIKATENDQEGGKQTGDQSESTERNWERRKQTRDQSESTVGDEVGGKQTDSNSTKKSTSATEGYNICM